MHWHPYYTFTNGGAVPPPAPTPSGVRKGRKRELIVSLRDVENKESTADFIKSQLRLRQGFTDHLPVKEAPRLSKAERQKQSRLAAQAMEAMRIEEENEQRRILQAKNDEIIKLIILASL